MLYMLFIFFFKQKTAYEMRISDWSSDVFSSDLLASLRGQLCRDVHPAGRGDLARNLRDRLLLFRPLVRAGHAGDAAPGRPRCQGDGARGRLAGQQCDRSQPWSVGDGGGQRCARAESGLGRGARSEEHTSELQSLMRNSYAVFCLKKTNKIR